MKGINNSNVVLQPSGLNNNEARLLSTIFSGAVSSGDRTKAGGGYMGLARPLAGGEFRSVKFMTHWYERGIKTDSQIMKSVKDCKLAGTVAFFSSDQLELSLRAMAEKVGVSKTVDALLNEYKQKSSYESRTLLSRKIVFQIATIINDESARLKGRSVSVDNVATKSSQHVSTRVTALDTEGETDYSDTCENLLRGFKPSKKFLDTVIGELDTKANDQWSKDIRSAIRSVQRDCKLAGCSEGIPKEELAALVLETINELCGKDDKGNGRFISLLYEKIEKHVLENRKNDLPFDQDRFWLAMSEDIKMISGLLEPIIVRAAIAQQVDPAENRRKTVAQLEKYWPKEGNPFATGGFPGLTDKKMIKALTDLKMRKGKQPIDAKDVLRSVKGMCPELAHMISVIARKEKARQFVQKMYMLLNNPDFNATLADAFEPEEDGNAKPTLLSTNEETVLGELELTYFEDELPLQPWYEELFNLPAQIDGKDTSYEDVMKKFKETLGAETAKALRGMTKHLESKPAVLMEALKAIFAESVKEIQEFLMAKKGRRLEDPAGLDNWIREMIEDKEIDLSRVTDLNTLKAELKRHRESRSKKKV